MQNTEKENMIKDKIELFSIIGEINNPKLIKYLLGFVKAFVDLRK